MHRRDITAQPFGRHLVLRSAVVAAFAATTMVALPGAASAATTVTDCPTTRAALVDDITTAGAGGTVRLTCATDTTIVFDAPITVSSNLTLDATGGPGTVAFDGDAQKRQTGDNLDGYSSLLLRVDPGATLWLDRLTLQNAASIAGLMLTTEVMITKIDEEDPRNKVSGSIR